MTNRKVARFLRDLGFQVLVNPTERTATRDAVIIHGGPGDYLAVDVPVGTISGLGYQVKARQHEELVALALHEAGFSVFSAIDFFEDIQGRMHRSGQLGQVCVRRIS